MPVYLILAGQAVKIGVTRNVLGRLIDYGIHNPNPVSLLRYLEGERAEERALHVRFRHLHIKGEWFQYHNDMSGDLGLRELEHPIKVKPAYRYVRKPFNTRMSDTKLRIYADPIRKQEILAKARATFLKNKDARDARRVKNRAEMRAYFARQAQAA